MNMQQIIAALLGLMDELNDECRKATSDLIDFFVQMPQSDAKVFFAADCGDQLIAIIEIARGFFRKKHGLEITDEEAFTIFNIIIDNYAYSCHKYPTMKAAMQKAAGTGFFGRMFGA